ncbi:hypothetical protein [Sphingobacterium sp. LRF_L2]|uniref:hypothetical protein n=1 Tax=Sphingobacterium sp. LRF_L2 TaxID=3369421 RepID=UPI003F6065F0
MKLAIFTIDALNLYNKITPAMRSGELHTWTVIDRDNGGICYNYTPKLWSEKVLLVPEIGTDNLLISTRHWRGGYVPNEDMKAFVLSKFVEVLLGHFRDSFDTFRFEK